MLGESIDFALREEAAYKEFYEQVLSEWQAKRRQAYVNTMGNQLTGPIPEFDVPDIDKKVVNELEKQLARAAVKYKVEDFQVYAALGLLSRSTGSHHNVGALPEILTFLRRKDALSYDQDKAVDAHYSECAPCGELSLAFGDLVSLYELKAGKVKMFYPKILSRFYDVSISSLVDMLDRTPIVQSHAETAVRLLDLTIDRHFGPYGQLADKMLVIATTPGRMPEYVNPDYNGHLEECLQCQVGMKNLDYGAPPNFPRLVERKQ